MNERDPWQAWGERWRGQPRPDVARLQRQAHHKRLRMQATLGIELLLLVAVLTQVAVFTPEMGVRWELFGAFASVLLVVGLGITIAMRREVWRADGSSVSELLALSRQRALVGIRLAWAQMVSLAILLAGSAVLGWPFLRPDRWMHDAALRQQLVFVLLANSPVVVGGVGVCLWYIRRQRRRLAEIASLELGDDEASAAAADRPSGQ